MSLHPAFEEYLAQLNPLIAQSKAAGVQPTPESARAALAGLNQFSAAPVEVASTIDRVVQYQLDGEVISVPVRIYVPLGYSLNDSVLFVHGGGHMAGDIEVYDSSARRTAAASKMIIVSVDYRRAPEAPFPAGLTDSYQVLLQLPELLADYDVTGTVHAVADSGGAAKVASIAMRTAAGQWKSNISRQVLLYPSLDYTLGGASVAELGEGFFLERDRIVWYFENYFPDGVDWQQSSPLNGPFTDSMPETLVIAAEYDPLRSEAEAYVDRVQAAGSHAELRIAPGMIHAYLFFETMVPELVAESYERIGQFLNTGHADAWS